MARTRRGAPARSRGRSDEQSYTGLARDPGFAELKRRYRRFAIPATIAFLVWYVAYVVCNNWARGFMDTRVIGHVNVALVFGLLQFLSTFVIAYLYSRYAGRRLDPLSTQLRDRFEKETGR
jgi:uncharacterized membrane protein (DUF485 family)